VKVGIVCPYSWDFPGGVQAHIRDLAEALITLGHEVSVIAPADDDDALPPYVVPAGRAVPVPYNGSVARLSFGLVSVARVRRWLRDGEFDVLHVHEPATPSLSLIACWSAVGPMVGTFHTSTTRSRAMAATSSILQTAIEKLSARIAVSEAARQTLVDHMGGDAIIVPNGVAVASFAGEDTLPGWPRPGGTLGFLGRLDEPRKGFAVLLAALPAIVDQVPGVQVLVAGPGDADDALARVPAELRDRVHLLGRVSEADKARAYRSVDVFVAPNTGGESFGIVLLEAMASRAPVLASDIDAFRQVLDDGEAGAMFHNEDPSSLAKEAVVLLEDPVRRETLRDQARVVAQRYDWETVARDVLRVYETVAVGGEKVREDVRGQALGRFSRLPRISDAGTRGGSA
jgi:phosphatidylinositol alpha-mannosyltransferase